MTTRRTILLSLGAAGLMASVSMPLTAASASPISAKAITQVFGDGLRFVAVALEYAQPIQATELAADDFAVPDRIVTEVYPARSSHPSDRAESGTFVIVALSPQDAAAALKSEPARPANKGRPDWKAGDHNVSDTTWIAPSAEVTTPDGLTLTSGVENLILDQFEQRIWTDPDTGDTLPYNLFVPTDYDPAQTYPLVNFMHDAGATSLDPLFTLKQGLGAISFASPEDQAKRPAFVLAPQFAEIVAAGDDDTSSMHQTVMNLIRALGQDFSIDMKRLYVTGQSGGGMLAMAQMSGDSDFYAAAYLVACQWGADVVKPMAGMRLFILVSQEDLKAFPGQIACTESWEEEGATVARAIWDGDWSPDQFQFAFDDLIAEGARINFVSLREGTVLAPGASTQGAAAHRASWGIAYGIAPIRDWLLSAER